MYSAKLNDIEPNSCRSRKVALLQDCRESLHERPIISSKRLCVLTPSPKAAKSSFAALTTLIMSPRQLKSHCTRSLSPTRTSYSNSSSGTSIVILGTVALSWCQLLIIFGWRFQCGDDGLKMLIMSGL